VNPDDYLPTLGETRPAETTRVATPVMIDGKQGMLVRKVFDSGRYQYGGPLKGLWIDQTAEENFQMIVDEPLSLTGFTKSSATLERPDAGWRARAETTTRVWSELNEAGEPVFRYKPRRRGALSAPTTSPSRRRPSREPSSATGSNAAICRPD
jgi:hypothetical protein